MNTLKTRLMFAFLILLVVNAIGFLYAKNFEGALIGSVMGFIIGFVINEVKVRDEE